MRISKALAALLAAVSAAEAATINIGGPRLTVRSDSVGDAQQLVTYDPVSDNLLRPALAGPLI